MALKHGCLVVSALLALGCRVEPLPKEGRPCSAADPCGPGTFCDPTTGKCVASPVTEAGVPLDLGVPRDLLIPDRFVEADAFLVPDGGCPSGYTQCGSECADLATNIRHCSACDSPCAAGQDCQGGVCTCMAGSRCPGCCDSDTCRFPGSDQDETACGAGGQPCASCADTLSCTTETCLASGVCDISIASGHCLIGGSCYTDGASNPAYPTAQCEQCVVSQDNTAWTLVPSPGCVLTLAGTGTAGFNDGPADQAMFNGPTGVAVSSTGEVYVADNGNHRIRVIAAGSVTTLAGGAKGFVDGTTSAARFSNPAGLALLDEAVYVADSANHSIRKIAAGDVTTIAGTGTAGFKDGQASSAQFNVPLGVVAPDEDAIYVADSTNHRIRLVSGGTVTTLAGGSMPGDKDGPTSIAQFNTPNGVTWENDMIFVADTQNHKIRVVDAASGMWMVSTTAGSGVAGFLDDSKYQCQFNSPTGVAAKGSIVLVADRDNHRVRRIPSGGSVTTAAGDGTAGYQDGPADAAHFDEPTDVAVDAAGTIYVADRKNHCIRMIIP